MYSLVELLDDHNRVIDLDIEKLLIDIRQNKLEVIFGLRLWLKFSKL